MQEGKPPRRKVILETDGDSFGRGNPPVLTDRIFEPPSSFSLYYKSLENREYVAGCNSSTNELP
jgi:hypothetical protein